MIEVFTETGGFGLILIVSIVINLYLFVYGIKIGKSPVLLYINAVILGIVHFSVARTISSEITGNLVFLLSPLTSFFVFYAAFTGANVIVLRDISLKGVKKHERHKNKRASD